MPMIQGTWRPAGQDPIIGHGRVVAPVPMPDNTGLRVLLKRIEGLTEPGLLRVPFVFQSPPTDTFTRQHSFDWSDYTTVGAGQFSRRGGRQLRTIQFSSLFVVEPEGGYGWTHYDPMVSRAMDPIDMTEELRDILESGSPFRMIAGQSWRWNKRAGDNRQELVMMATMRSLSVSERSGEPDSRYFDVSFTEWRDPTFATRAVGRGTTKSRHLPQAIELRAFALTSSERGGRNPAPAQTLQELAEWAYGSSRRWRDIVSANPWLTGISSSHDLGVWDTPLLKRHGKANSKIVVPQRPPPAPSPRGGNFTSARGGESTVVG